MMKRALPLLLGIAAMAFCLTACEGDEGPAGPAGPQGPPGDPGDPGQNALNTCAECHNNDTELLAIELQFAAGPHYDNVYWGRTTSSCTPCHTHNGFIATYVDGGDPQSFDNPVPINCRTCHEIHTDFTDDDYSLTTVAAVDLIEGDGTFDQGSGNLCANCHQSRSILPVVAIGGDQITLGADGGVTPAGSRYGPHYGPQANVMVAASMYEFAGSMTYPTVNDHAADCNACHMVDPVFTYGPDMYVAGGHVFNLSNDGEDEAIGACSSVDCHPGATSFNHLVGRSTVEGLLAQLRSLLEDEGIMRAEDYYANPGTFDADVAAAFLNWKFIYHDGSYGTHNPAYARVLLTNTIEAMEARLPEF